MLRKLKKALPAVISAVLCVTMALGITASAASAWSDAKALSGGKYSSTYIKWAEKYSGKDAKNTVKFSKSKTKKFIDKMTSQLDLLGKKDCQLSISIITKDSVVATAIKGSKIKNVIYTDDSGIAMLITPEAFSIITFADKKKAVVPIPEDADFDELMDNAFEEALSNVDGDMFDSGIAENAKGKSFKFKSGEKTYYYEEFETDYGKLGYLFDSNGNPIAMTDGKNSACLKISYTVKDSAFTVPKGYTEVGLDELDLTTALS